MKCLILFSRKDKYIICLSFAEFAHSIVNVKETGVILHGLQSVNTNFRLFILGLVI